MRLVRLGLGLLALAAVPACGGSSSGNPDAGPPDAMGGNSGFVPPMDVTKANMESNGTWMELGDADWSCLNTASDDMPLQADLTLDGQINDFQNMSNGVPDPTVVAFAGTDYMTPFANGTVTGDGSGNFTGLVIPAGTKRVGYKITAASYMDTFLLNQYYDPASTTGTQKISAISQGLASALPAFVGFERTPGTGVLAGAMRDCSGHEVSNAIATVSSTSMTHTDLDGAVTYYFSAAAGLPVNHKQRTSTDQDGLFAVFELPAQTGNSYIQVWGFTSAADVAQGEAGLTLLAELPSPVLADTVITGSIEPLRTN